MAKVLDWKRIERAIFDFINAFLPPVPPTIQPSPVVEPEPPAPQPSRLLQAIIQVESNGNDNAIGDKHLANKAYGCLQIRKPVCVDVNNALGTNYTPQQMLGNRALSIKVFHAYLNIWATSKRIGRPVTDEDRARIWNGGPTGWKRNTTLGYWSKVKKYL